MTVISSNCVRTQKVEVSKRLSFSRETSFFPLLPSWCTPLAHQPTARQAQRKLQIQRGRLHARFRLPATLFQIPLTELLITLPLCGASRLKSSMFSRDTPPLPSQALRISLCPSAITAVGYTNRCTERSCFTVVLSALQGVYFALNV